MPENASFHTEGGLGCSEFIRNIPSVIDNKFAPKSRLFHVCIGLQNLSVKGTLEKVRER